MAPRQSDINLITRGRLGELLEEIGLKPSVMSLDQLDVYGSLINVIDKGDPKEIDQWLTENRDTVVASGLAPLAFAELYYHCYRLGNMRMNLAHTKIRLMLEKHFSDEEVRSGRLPAVLVAGRASGSLPVTLYDHARAELDCQDCNVVVNREVAAAWLEHIVARPVSRFTRFMMRLADLAATAQALQRERAAA